MAKRRIGLMGGSFNPIHRRHLQIAASALNEMKLDRVEFIPNGNPPHKQHELADAGHRFEMTRLAVIPYEKFTVSDIEIIRDGIVYTVDTLKLMHRAHPGSEFIYIIGEDTLFELEHWMRPLEVFKLCSFAVCMRQNQDISDHPSVIKLQDMGVQIRFLSLSPFDISASDIRRQIAQGVVNEALLTPEVCEYIRTIGLYGCSPLPGGSQHAYTMLKEDLSDDRLLHSLAVAYTANRLAKIHHLDVQACELAGLLHDCAKCLPLHALQKIARDSHLQLSDIEMHSNALLHGPAGAVFAQTKYGVHQPDVLSAIAAHTTGYAGMTPFDTVIYLADKIEPYRNDIPDLDEIRELADVNLYSAACRMMINSRTHILETGRPLHPATNQTIQWVQDHMQ